MFTSWHAGRRIQAVLNKFHIMGYLALAWVLGSSLGLVLEWLGRLMAGH
ncbi:hypothetical protein GCM10007392_39760 [Saccharospirillum salsuginis]|uniref:Uncharacterized protein n=1 Tax=Saccharospirillum salsuginis TaxID=418750 RepID=A0A918NHL2_9GAMM|nr:hypothetical protein GCM10007392_39760 [Saccharospirillum salsuginis]